MTVLMRRMTLEQKAGQMSLAPAQWRTARIPLECLRDAGATMATVSKPFAITASEHFEVALADMRLVTNPAGAICPKQEPVRIIAAGLANQTAARSAHRIGATGDPAFRRRPATARPD